MAGQEGVVIDVKYALLYAVWRKNLDSLVASSYKESIFIDFETPYSPSLRLWLILAQN